jgi:hypothetical protein
MDKSRHLHDLALVPIFVLRMLYEADYKPIEYAEKTVICKMVKFLEEKKKKKKKKKKILLF